MSASIPADVSQRACEMEAGYGDKEGGLRKKKQFGCGSIYFEPRDAFSSSSGETSSFLLSVSGALSRATHNFSTPRPSVVALPGLGALIADLTLGHTNLSPPHRDFICSCGKKKLCAREAIEGPCEPPQPRTPIQLHLSAIHRRRALVLEPNYPTSFLFLFAVNDGSSRPTFEKNSIPSPWMRDSLIEHRHARQILHHQ